MTVVQKAVFFLKTFHARTDLLFAQDSLDPDQDRQNVGPDLDPNCFAKVINDKRKETHYNCSLCFLHFRQRPPGYPISSGALGGPYPPTLLNSTARYPHGLFPPGLPHPGLPHPFASGPKQESQDSHRWVISLGFRLRAYCSVSNIPHIWSYNPCLFKSITLGCWGQCLNNF